MTNSNIANNRQTDFMSSRFDTLWWIQCHVCSILAKNVWKEYNHEETIRQIQTQGYSIKTTGLDA